MFSVKQLTPLAVAVAAAATVAAAPAAQAATLHQDGRTPQRLLLQDTAGETNLVTVHGSSRTIFIEDLNAPIDIAGVPTCMPAGERVVRCTAVRELELDLGIGPDNVAVDTPVAIEVHDAPASSER